MKNVRMPLSILLGLVIMLTSLVVACKKEAPVSTPTTPSTPASTPAAAPKVIELTYASPYSPPNPYTVADEAWIDYIHEKTNGQVKITPYWGGTLVGKQENVAEMTEGVADIGQIVVFAETGYEILNAFMCYGWDSTDSARALRVGQEIFRKFPEYQKEFPGLVVLGFTNTLYDTLMTVDPIKTMGDLKGHTYNGDFPTADAFMSFGATAVKIPPPELYTQMEKGLLDGLCFPLETLFGFKFAEVVNYVNLDVSCPNQAIPNRVFNQNKFNSLPADLQKIFVDSEEYWMDQQLQAFNNANTVGIDFAKGIGVEFINLSAAEKEKWQNALKDVAYARAKKVDSIGKPGTAILEETERLIKEYSK
jgi:TRAP-type C4-dicarboxylate transport system substrate-binding protein